MAIGKVEAEQERLRAILRLRAAEAQKVNKIGTYFPDAGPYRRELYQKHIEFFAAGARYKERLFMAANRCLTPWTAIQTDRGERQILELLGETGFDVPSWDGGSRCTKPAGAVFLKGIEPAFRLHLDNGATFDCSGTHRVLTIEGWVEVAQLIRRAGGLHLWRGALGSKANYGMASHPDGRRLPLGSDTGREPLPSQAYVPGHGLDFRPEDAAEPRFECTHAYQDCDLPANLDDPTQIADLCAKFPDPKLGIDAEWPSALRQALEQSQPEFSLGREEIEVALDQSLKSVRAFLECDSSSILLCQSHTPLVGGNRIVSIVPLGLQPILDFSVQGTHNYEIGGVIHHNCGKSDSGALESTSHATGIYPKWWTGRRFSGPTDGWCCGTTGETTRDIVQEKLLGRVGEVGTGMIPKHLIVKTTSRRGGIADALESIVVRHVSGKNSTIGLKSYQQGRESFEGTAKSYIWFDEEPPEDVYTEGLYRTVTTRGLVYTTFTPLQGMSEVVKGFVEPETDAADDFKWYIQAGWNDVPHIHDDEKKALIATTPPYQIKARTEGEPALGAGAIYPIAQEDIMIPSRAVPMNWVRCYAMDVGWNRTAALWFAKNPGNGQIEVYDEHYIGQGEPPSHAMAIKARGEWIPGVIDPACQSSSQVDGARLIDLYRKLGLKLTPAENSVEAGIQEVWTLLVSGQLKVHERCFNFFREFRQYHRDDKGKGKIVKKTDHLVDCLRYGVVSGQAVMKLKPIVQPTYTAPYNDHNGRGWMLN